MREYHDYHSHLEVPAEEAARDLIALTVRFSDFLGGWGWGVVLLCVGMLCCYFPVMFLLSWALGFECVYP